MHKQTAERIERLRSRASIAEASLSDLKEQLAANQDEWVNAQLKLAEGTLTDVEAFFIGTLKREEHPPRTLAQEAYILNHAEYHLEKVVLPQIKAIKDMVTKFGPSVRTFG
jgi:uncharacterized coiled-coil protein SlyX